MTTPEITPEILRAIVNHPDAPPSTLLELARWADDLEPIEKWAEILHDAAAPVDGCWVSYEHSPADMRATARRQARAVISLLGPFIDQQIPADAGNLDVERAEAKVFIGRTHAIDIELGGHGPDVSIDRFGDPVYPEQDAPVHPRTWDDLRDVPDKVRWVRDKDGDEIVRDAKRPYGWKWLHLGTSVGATEQCMTDYAPYTEIAEP